MADCGLVMAMPTERDRLTVALSARDLVYFPAQNSGI
jgi:hypothetical protein